MIEPRERLLWIVVAVAVVGVIGLAVPFVGGFAPYALAFVVVAVVVDTVLARSPSIVRVQRRVPERLIEGRAGVLRYDVVSDRDVDVEVVDSIPGEPWLVARATIESATTTTLTPPARIRRRGRHAAPPLTVRTFGPLGLVARRQRRHAGTGDDVVVALDVAAIADDVARVIRSGDLDGRRRRRVPGQGKELDGLRPYRVGDDVRLVDWKASARRGDLVVKELVPETRQDLVVVVDAGRQLMGRTACGGRRFDRAVALGLFVAAAAIERGDRAGLAVVDDDVRAFVPPHEGKATLKVLADATVDVDAIAVEPGYQEVAALLGTRLKRRSVICLVTDVVDEAGATALARSLTGLRQRHAVIVVALADATLRQLATPGDADDNDTTLRRRAAQQLLSHRRRALQLLERSALVVDVDDDGIDNSAGIAAVAAWWRLKQSGRV